MQTLFITKGKTESTKGERDGGRVLISPYSIFDYVYQELIESAVWVLFILQF